MIMMAMMITTKTVNPLENNNVVIIIHWHTVPHIIHNLLQIQWMRLCDSMVLICIQNHTQKLFNLKNVIYLVL